MLCTTYPALDPIRMLDYPLEDVIDLMRQHLDYNRRTRQREARAPQAKHGNTQDVIYRKADDSWF